MGWKDTFNKMKSHYQIHNSTSYQEEYKKYQTGKISHKTLKKNIDDNVFHHIPMKLLRHILNVLVSITLEYIVKNHKFYISVMYILK